MRALGLFAPLALLLMGAEAPPADEPTQVIQTHQTFDPRTLSVASGSVVEVANMDDVNHNIQIIDPKGERRDYGIDKPGETVRLEVGGPGVYSVICGIHPRMKMTITAK